MAKALQVMDCKILEGYRDKERQDFLYDIGKSHLKFPSSQHNAKPSLAVDAVPYPIDWNDRERMTLFAGIVLGVASELGVTIRWGGDWDTDTFVMDNSFDDLAHFEIVED